MTNNDLKRFVNRFEEHIEARLDRHELPGGVFYNVSGAASVDAANRCMERVRAYRV